MSKRQLSVTLGFVRDISLITAISILAFVVLDKEIEPDIQGDEYDKVEDTTTRKRRRHYKVQTETWTSRTTSKKPHE